MYTEWLAQWALDHLDGKSETELDFRSCRVVSYEICQELVQAVVADPEPIVVCHTVNITVCNTSTPPAGGNCQLCGNGDGFPGTGWNPNDPPIIVPPKEDRPDEFEHISEQFFHDTYEFATVHGFNYETLLRIINEAEFSKCTSSFAGCMFQAVFDYLDGLFYANQVVTPGQLQIGRVNPFFYQANPELLSPILDYVQQHENDPSAVQAGRVMSEVISRGYVPGNVQEELAGLAGLHAGLIDKSHFQQVGLTHVDVLRQLPTLVSDIAPYPADVLFRDYAQVANHPDAFPIIPLIIKAIAKAGAGALLDIGVQVGFEYFMGGHSDLESAIQAMEVDWWSVGSAAIEANISPKYAAFLGAGTGAVSEVASRLAAGEELSLYEIFETGLLGAATGFIPAHVGDYIGKFSTAFVKYGFLLPYDGLKGQFGDLFNQVCRNYPVFRKDAMRALWAETNIAPVSRGPYFEEILTNSRYQNYTWVNIDGEKNGPVDYFLGDTAVQLKSADNISTESKARTHVKKGLEQMDKALGQGIIFGGVQHNFSQAQIDIVVPESMAGYISDREEQMLDYIQEQIDVLQNYPNLTLSSITLNIGVFHD